MHAAEPRCNCSKSLHVSPGAVRRLVHPDKCSHPQAKDASAAVNQVGNFLEPVLAMPKCSGYCAASCRAARCTILSGAAVLMQTRALLSHGKLAGWDSLYAALERILKGNC